MIDRILLKKSGQKTPRIELQEMGPSLDLVVRRTKIASDDLFKTALRRPKQILVRPFEKYTLFHCNAMLTDGRKFI